MQLPGNVWTKLLPRHFKAIEGVYEYMCKILEVLNTSLAPNFEFRQS